MMYSLPPWLEVHDPRFVPLVLGNAVLETLVDGLAWAEGPVWFADTEQLLFSDLPNDRVMRWTAGGVSVFRQPSQFANGHTRDRQGRLVGCHHGSRSVTRIELDGRVTVLADGFEGARLNGPNDVIAARDGTIWFTDPLYGGGTDYEGGKHECALPPTLYRLDPDGTLGAASRAFRGPNGLALSPDERILYVCETGAQFGQDDGRAIHAIDLAGSGGMRVFYRVAPGLADGIACDEEGRVWSSAGDGVHCIGPDGTLLGKILTGGTVSNLCFGGRQRARLFLCASHTLKAIYTNVRGAQRP